MSDLEFRKFLTTYGINYEEYKNLSDSEKEELKKKYTSENKGNILKGIGKGCQGVGCLIMLVPLLIFFVYLLFSMIF